MDERAKVAWTLALMSPVIAELMSGSSPPLEFFNPLFFTGLLGMYGAGVLLVREIAITWRQGWATVLMLGAAYAIIEEGLAVKSFFDPGWADLGDLAVYGRAFEVNWVWSVWLTIFHATISIALPILLVRLFYPRFENERLLTDLQLRIVLVLFVLDIFVFALLFMVNYVPPGLQYLLALLTVAFLVFVAKRLPRTLVSPRHHLPTWSPRRFYALGFLMIFGGFLIASGSFTRAIHPVYTILLLLVVSAATLSILQHKMGATDNRAQKGCFAAGLLSFLVVMGFLSEFIGNAGMSVVAVFGALFVVDLVRWSTGRKCFTFLRRMPQPV